MFAVKKCIALLGKRDLYIWNRGYYRDCAFDMTVLGLTTSTAPANGSDLSLVAGALLESLLIGFRVGS